jgi:hypothetical protein
MMNGRCRMHGGPSPGAPKGNRNAVKHGRYNAKAIEDRRRIATLLRVMRELAKEVSKSTLEPFSCPWNRSSPRLVGG